MKRAGKGLLLLLVAALAIALFNGVAFRKKTNNRPLPSHYKKGVFHLHSRFSDGLGGIDEICRDARAQNLNFVILTDHGRPNRKASLATAWNQDTLLVGASEFSLHAGHMASAGYRLPGYVFPPEAQEAIDEVNRDNGVTFLSHPFDSKIPWTDWQVHDFTGIEILSLYQMAKKHLWYSLTFFPLQYLLNPDCALTGLISCPKKEMEVWDNFNREGRYFGIYALDSHAKLQIGKKASFHFPSYGATFRILNVYVKVDRELARDALEAASTVIAALRRGSFFNVIESLGSANGFEYYYVEAGGRRTEMGGNAPATGGSLILELPFEFATDIAIYRNGAVFRTFNDNNRRKIAMPIDESGVYRCEVRLHSGRFRKLPWILANPIFVARPAAQVKPQPVAEPRRFLNRAEGYFQVEKNSRSFGEVTTKTAPDNRSLTNFSFALQREGPAVADYWTAMARREKQDFSPYRGFVFEARGSRPMRFWMQFRTESAGRESAFRHSFLVGEEWRRIVIPFERFHRLYGKNALPDLAHVSALFILIDGENSFSGSRGTLELSPLGLY